MRLREVIRSPAVTCGLTTTLAEAAHLLHRHDVGALVVLDGAGRIAGIVTDRDLTVRGYGHDLGPSSTVDEVLTRRPHTVGVEADTKEAATRMMEHGVRRLPVLDPDGSLAGMVSLDDLTIFVDEEADTLRRVLAAQTGKGSTGWTGTWD